MQAYPDQRVCVTSVVFERARLVIAEVVEAVVETQQRILRQADERELNFTFQEFGGHMGNCPCGEGSFARRLIRTQIFAASFMPNLSGVQRVCKQEEPDQH